MFVGVLVRFLFVELCVRLYSCVVISVLACVVVCVCVCLCMCLRSLSVLFVGGFVCLFVGVVCLRVYVLLVCVFRVFALVCVTPKSCGVCLFV